jgi:hypothetical protein
MKALSAVQTANAAKLARIALSTRTDWYAKAYRRVMRSPRLRPLADVILADYEDTDHYTWVATARVSTIYLWAQFCHARD